jgi:hypothetical protein
VHLLPPFDELLVAYRDRSAVIDGRFLPRVGAGGVMFPTIVVGGRVVGTWRRMFTTRVVAVHFRPFVRLKATEREGVE